MKKFFIVCLTAFFILGCKSSFNTAPILNFEDQPVTSGMTMAKMEKCIILAGSELGWKIVKIKSGMMEGSITRRGHTAVVSIPYSTKKYSILYKNSSEGLYADGQNIHKTYNTWVNNLDSRINVKINETLYE
ncbi:hypothetical protein LJC48_02275 [Desulfovibrio sp. OttesenSCG-928-C06]|nr:hypothetical protein [Desulfovibrio sp. OttesenSCG-928-C06]